MDPSSSLLGSSVNDFECFGRQTKIENWLQFSIFNFKVSAENRKTKPCHRLQHCRKSNMDLIFLFIVDRIKVKYKLCFNILSKGNKVQNFRCVCHSSIQFLFKIKSWKLIAIFYFLKFVIRKNTKVPNRTSSLGRSASPHALGEFILPQSLPLSRYTSLERRRKREIRIYRVVTFPNMNDFSAEYIKVL